MIKKNIAMRMIAGNLGMGTYLARAPFIVNAKHLVTFPTKQTPLFPVEK
jgi:hypothetical protein